MLEKASLAYLRSFVEGPNAMGRRLSDPNLRSIVEAIAGPERLENMPLVQIYDQL